MCTRFGSKRIWKGLAALSAAMVVALVLVVLAGGDEKDGSRPSPPSEAEEETADLYTVEVRTGRLRQLTEHQGEGALDPAWWPGRSILFASFRCDSCPSKVHYLRGGRIHVIGIRGARHLFQPAWAPDGRRIAVVALGDGIRTVDTKTGIATRITSGQSDGAPAWSPQGHAIAFDRRVRGANYDLFTVNPRTGEETRLTRDRRPQTSPAWSPDGSRIAFAQQLPNGSWSLMTMRADGRQRRQLVAGSGSAQQPAWSPDGSKIAFVAQGPSHATIAVADAVGGGKVRRLTGASLTSSKPAWSPDGEQIVFSAIRTAGDGG